MYDAINNVLNRINSIEQKFFPRHIQEGQFQNFLKVELDKSKKQPKLAENSNIIKGNNFSNEFSDIIAESARKYGVDSKLVDAVAKTESNYSPNAVSESGAIGIMQLMPDTAASLGVNDIYNPRDNIEGGTKYIKQLLNTFDGDVSKAVAAYNAGPQAVKKYNGVPPYAETKNYVRKVLDLYS